MSHPYFCHPKYLKPSAGPEVVYKKIFFFCATTGLTMKVLPFRYFCILSHRNILCLVHQQDNPFIAMITMADYYQESSKK